MRDSVNTENCVGLSSGAYYIAFTQRLGMFLFRFLDKSPMGIVFGDHVVDMKRNALMEVSESVIGSIETFDVLIKATDVLIKKYLGNKLDHSYELHNR